LRRHEVVERHGFLQPTLDGSDVGITAARVLGELGTKSTVTFLVLWLAGLWGRPYILAGTPLFASLTALLDVVLVLLIFKRDIRLR
jgi:hypothetical protein